MTLIADILAELATRRQALDMSCKVVARRSGVARRTVERVLGGESGGVRVQTLAAIASALGADIGLVRKRSTGAIRSRRAKVKANRLVRVGQGNAALEGQAIPQAAAADLCRRLEARLLAGPAIRLWSEP